MTKYMELKNKVKQNEPLLKEFILKTRELLIKYGFTKEQAEKFNVEQYAQRGHRATDRYALNGLETKIITAMYFNCEYKNTLFDDRSDIRFAYIVFGNSYFGVKVKGSFRLNSDRFKLYNQQFEECIKFLSEVPKLEDLK